MTHTPLIPANAGTPMANRGCGTAGAAGNFQAMRPMIWVPAYAGMSG